jgi:putative hydrolase of the HAD superfamily
MIMRDIKNIIFDLGGVLLNIDYNKTIAAFREMGVKDFEQMFTQFHANDLFTRLETGRVSNDEFYDALKTVIPIPVSNNEIDTAWNAMLLSYRSESLATLEELAQRYSLFILSNTNRIHLARFQQIFTRDTGKPLLDEYFGKCWYSHMIGLRKPGKEVYEFVLQDEGLVAAETIFIDDTIDNIETAKKLGIRTHLMLPHERIGNIGL